MKYDFDLDMDSDNSNSLILRNIKPNSKVLEMGPAFGRMTKYLKQQLNCFVCIVEKDSTAGKVAQQFADMSFIGNSSGNGNIDHDIWYSHLSLLHKFDYIIFADVLEHLYNPWLALKRASNLLNKDGSMLISVPNFTHNAILIDIMAHEKFEYKEIGLLDNTHIRFFNRNSLNEMVEKAGLKIVQKLDPHNAPENTEFKNSYHDLPAAVGEFLQSRADGEVYQFVWELKHA